MSTFLIGMPGSGKTTVIDLYESICHKQIYDTDAFITSRHGDINAIFSDYGEEYFRELETEVIREICSYGDDALVSTGGGAVLREENVRLFKKSGEIVYLRARIDTLLNRLEGDSSRPLLAGDKKERLTKLYEERARIYECVADFIIDTDGLTPREVLKKFFMRREEGI